MANLTSKYTERQLKRFGRVRKLPLEHACKQIIDMKPPRKVNEDDRDKLVGWCEQRQEHGWTGR